MSKELDSNDRGTRVMFKEPQTMNEFLEQQMGRLIENGYPVENMSIPEILSFGNDGFIYNHLNRPRKP